MLIWRLVSGFGVENTRMLVESKNLNYRQNARGKGIALMETVNKVFIELNNKFLKSQLK